MRILVLTATALLGFAGAAHAFDGNYTNTQGNFKQSATISKAANGSYKVKLDVRTPGCGGEFDGSGTATGDKLVARTSDRGDECRITITRKGTAISVAEEKCMTWHGPRCEFTGTLNKR